MKIELINTGSELMLGYILNSHQQWICRQLSDRGYIVQRQSSVDDAGPEIRGAVADSMTRAELILVTGGLGPTSDDRTREMISELLGKPLREDPEVLKHIESFFGRRNRPAPASTRLQALVPEGAMVLHNPNGTAPGLAMEFEIKPRSELSNKRGLIIMLPGPPREMRPMFRDHALPLIERFFGQRNDFACVTLKTTGIGESFLEERVAPSLSNFQGLEIGYCARVGEVELRLLAQGAEARQVVENAEQISRELLGSYIYGKNDEQLDAKVVQLLSEKRKTLALAESCTGGFIANRITNIPGASAVFLAGCVTYSNEAKVKFLGVKSETLAANGAVSEAVAAEMARGASLSVGADYAISVTGIAGPSGGSTEKPVGTVYIGLATPEKVWVKKYLNQYDRETFKFLTSQQALDLLRRELLSFRASE